MHFYSTGLKQLLLEQNNLEIAAGQKAYLLHQFSFIGIKTPERRNLCTLYCKANSYLEYNDLKSVVVDLWDGDYREFQYAAAAVLVHHKKYWQPDLVDVFEYCITHKSWWDSVDLLIGDCLGHFFKIYPQLIPIVTRRWNHSDDIWLQRCSILFQKSYKQQTDTVLLFNYINHVAASKEFFVRKAIGWALREYAKTNPDWVKAFVEQHSLSPLSKREALKHLGN